MGRKPTEKLLRNESLWEKSTKIISQENLWCFDNVGFKWSEADVQSVESSAPLPMC